MKLSELISKLQAIQEEYGDLECVYSKDDEGNDYDTINYCPSVGEFDNKEKYFEIQDEDNNEYFVEINAVCVN